MALVHPPGSDLALLPLAIVFIGVPLALVLTVPAILGGVIAAAWLGDLACSS